ncbi:MAG: TerB family tellurite resistance protein [Saprospiraceae bacterium]
MLGAFIGGIMKPPLGSIMGFFFGSMLGHYLLDYPKEKEAEQSDFKAYKRRQGAFIYHVFTLCAKIAKADGSVSRGEINFMEQLMRQQFRLNDLGRADAIKTWKNSKNSNTPFEVVVRTFYQDFGRERHQVLNMMDLLFAAAAADGGLHPREEVLLKQAAHILGINGPKYQSIKSRYYHIPQQEQRWNALDPHYAILGARASESMSDIKKKFHVLAMQWHPDKVAARGGSPDALRHAKEKFQQINNAYERIVEARKK